MTFLELLVFTAFLSGVFWLIWRSMQQEMKLRQAIMEKEARQTLLYERLSEKLEDMQDGEIIT